jgi:hypothetical protein
VLHRSGGLFAFGDRKEKTQRRSTGSFLTQERIVAPEEATTSGDLNPRPRKEARSIQNLKCADGSGDGQYSKARDEYERARQLDTKRDYEDYIAHALEVNSRYEKMKDK